LPDTLTGQVRRVVFRREETGYLVASLDPAGGRAPVTIVGKMPGIAPGETLVCTGRWENDPRHGRQFFVETFRQTKPAGVETIRRYLGSGLIKGIGKVTADALVKAFGEKTLDVIEHQPQRLREAPGIGRVKSAMIIEAWRAGRDQRELALLLEQAGAPLSLAPRIQKVFGDRAAEQVRADPYRLVAEVRGVGFLTADRLARAFGFAADDPSRLRAGLLHVLEEAIADGHTAALVTELVARAAALLEAPTELLDAQVEQLVRGGHVRRDELDGAEVVSPTGLWLCEAKLAASILATRQAPSRFRAINGDKALVWVQDRLKLRLTERQGEAVLATVREPVVVITGGPGTGKTTIVRAVCEIGEAMKRRVLLCAPTGRAAKRLAEVSGREAKTVHRLLEVNPARGFDRTAENPLEGDLVLCDEASMLDAPLAMHLAEAVPPGGHLVLVGDVDQLPSVGPGNVLGDLIASGRAHTVRLDKIFRQAGSSRIVPNAHRIREGQLPEISATKDSDFFFLPEEDPVKLRELVVDLVARRLPQAYGLDPREDIMVLAPMHKGESGVARLNEALRDKLNPTGRTLRIGEREYREGDRVMQTANDYDRDIYNGDLGRVQRVSGDGKGIIVDFDGRLVEARGAELDDLVMAYAVSIHKSQGSEYPCVVVPLHSQHYILLARNLLYTAVTRGKRLVVLCGSPRALRRAVTHNPAQTRRTLLGKRLRDEKRGRLI
jgi:exodeoxyribonuclease V alpha subunit